VVGLHASLTVSDETIRDAGRLCAELGTILHVHVAEDRVDVDDARGRGYAGPLERLLALEALPAGSILAHGVHLSSDQVRRAEDAGCWLVQNPRSNHHNGVGYPAALRGSAHVALGTDGFPADMLRERSALHDLGTPAGENGSTLDRRCVASLQLAGQLLEETCDAPPPGANVENWLRNRARAARNHLQIGERTVCSNGKLLSADMDAIRDTARHEAQRLWARLPQHDENTRTAKRGLDLT
jgi:hypothetical protein